MYEYLDELIGEFGAWVRKSQAKLELSEGEEVPGESALSYYFDQWMGEKGVEATYGDHEFFLLLFILVAARLQEQPDFFGKWGKDIQRLVALEGPVRPPVLGLPRCLDRDYWKLAVFRHFGRGSTHAAEA